MLATGMLTDSTAAPEIFPDNSDMILHVVALIQKMSNRKTE